MTQDRQRRMTEAETARLLEEAGPRPEIPAGDLDLIRNAARAEWQRLVPVGEPYLARWTVAALALAASLALAVGLAWWLLRYVPKAPPVVVATVELSTGLVESRPASGEEPARRVSAGAALSAGLDLVTVETAGAGPSRLALALGSGHSIRLDEGTALRLVSDHRLELLRGAVYVDSRPLGPGPAGARPVESLAGSGPSPLEIVTSRGRVTEMGTQFEVRLENGGALSLRLRVREGSVSLSRDGETIPITVGEQLSVRPDGSLERAVVEPSDPGWAWVLEAAPALEIEGRTLSSYLDWVSRETGLRLRWASLELEASSTEIRLFGSIREMTPDESLDVILPGSGLGYRIEKGEILVSAVETEPGPARQNS